MQPLLDQSMDPMQACSKTSSRLLRFVCGEGSHQAQLKQAGLFLQKVQTPVDYKASPKVMVMEICDGGQSTCFACRFDPWHIRLLSPNINHGDWGESVDLDDRTDSMCVL